MNTRSRLDPVLKKKLEEKLNQNKTSRIKYLPVLVMSLPFYYGVYYIFSNVSPDSIANLLLPNSYLPLLIAFFLANFFLFTYIFLNKNFGLLIGLFLTTLVFMRLQQVVFEAWWLGLLAVLLLGGPVLRLTIFRE